MFKSIIKKSLNLLAIILILPFFAMFWALALFGNKDAAFAGFSQFFSLFPGQSGSYLRTAFYHLSMSHCDLDLVIGFGALFSQKNTELHAGCYIGPQCNIGSCCIEKNCLLGSGVHIMSGKGQHNFNDLNKPIKDQGGTFEKISIGKNCWIGNGALIMANIGDNCIIGAGSVVTHDLAANSIAAGNPAKIIKLRT